MRIDRNNYEAFFLDFHEGNLSEGLTRELFSFLDSNPDLKEEFESFEMISVLPSDKKYFGKDSLKKDTITSSNYKTWFVGYIESDLTSEQKKEVEAYLQKNPSLKPELEIFKQTKLVPDHQIIFESKKQLKRGGKVILFTPQFNRIAVAAFIAILLITYFLFRSGNEKMISHRENIIPKTQQRISPSVPKENQLPDLIISQEMKKKMAQKSNPSVRKNYEKENKRAEERTVPVKEEKTPEPLLTQHDEVPQNNVLEEKDSVLNTFAENKKPEPFKPTTTQLSQVFSDDELKELGMKTDIQQKEKASLWDIASKGVNEISKATGTEISMKKQTDEIEDTKTYALALGKFSVSHTSGK